jgi:hypothetical protein
MQQEMAATGLSMEMRIAHALIMHFDVYQGSTLGSRDCRLNTAFQHKYAS